MWGRHGDPDELRVCIITGYRPTAAGGGMEKHVYELVNGLLDRGADVEIICEDRSFLPDPSNTLADRILGISPESLEFRGWTELYEEKSKRFAELLDAERYDIVHCHSHYGRDAAIQLSQLRQRPGLITTFHLTPLGQLERMRQLGIPEPEGAPIDCMVGEMEKTAARLSDRCIAVSRGVQSEIVRFYGIGEARAPVIHNWYDPEHFVAVPKQRAREVLGLNPESKYLIYIGHFGLHRGQLLAEAMRRLPSEIRLLVVHPEADPAIEEEFGDRVQFVGYTSSERLASYFSASDLHCFPTVYSGFGLVLIEGMACGCPAVVFNFSAMSEIVTEECGYLVERATADAYAAGILKALREGDHKRSAAVRRAGHFQEGPQIDRVLNLYKEVHHEAKNVVAVGGSDE
jgi:glycosyltransferase involved in cell wall biosynthesis